MAAGAPRWLFRARVSGFFATALFLDLSLALSGRAGVAVSSVGLLLGVAFAGAGAVLAARRSEGRLRAAWLLLAAGIGLWGAMWALRSFSRGLDGQAPSAWMDAGGLFSVVAVAAVLLANPSGRARGELSLILDGVIAAVGLSMVSHQLILRPLFEADVAPLSLWLLSARAIGALVLLALVAMTAIRRRRLAAGAPAPPLDQGLALVAISSSALLGVTVGGFSTPWVELAETGLLAGFVLVGMAGLRKVAGVGPPAARDGGTIEVSVLPLLMMAAGTIVVLPDLMKGPVLTVNLVLGYTGQLLVVFRLLVALIENGRLTRRMQAKVGELEAAYARLSELDELKSDFVATASHELRTPLTAVQGFIETLLRPEIMASPEESREYLMIARRSASRLRTLIENLLLVSRIEQSGAIGSLASLDLAELAGEIVAEHGDGTHPVVVRVPGSPVPVRMDRMHARTVVENLLSNARKFSPPGSEITVSVRAREDVAELAVEDRGPGVPRDDRPQLFEKFFRGRGSAGLTSGSGLGLYIVRRLAEAVGGSVEYDGTRVEGARFVLRLPLSSVPGEDLVVAPEGAAVP
ncbi:MAG: HAMP domain-containing histidine kinase [Actinobacteria bacterium]|nr:HAMP domain-containing histidine kinase [Actinomycetota bacterium]